MRSKREEEMRKEVFAIALNELAELCYKNAKDKGFWDDEAELIWFVDAAIIASSAPLMGAKAETKARLIQRIISLCDAEKLALEHSEISENLEGLRKDPKAMDQHCSEFTNDEIENADKLIRILDRCARRKLRIGEAVLAKMAFNATRERKHGKNF